MFGGAAALAGGSLLAVALIWGYAVQPTLPRGMTVAGRAVGDLTPAELREQLAQAEARLGRREAQWASPAADVPAGAMTLGALGLRTSAEQIAAEAEALAAGPWWQRAARRWQLRDRSYAIGIAFDRDAFGAAVEAAWPEVEARRPTDARRVITPGDAVAYEPGQSVRRIDSEAMREQLTSRLSGDVWGEAAAADTPLQLALPLRTVEPEVTVKSLKAQGVERKITEFTTIYPGSSTGRIHNIRVTAETVHDTLLAPDEVFDYGKVIQETTRRVGYKNAPVIFNGKFVPGIGGGICQVSTTLYNAVLRVGLEVVERRNHSLPVRYAPLGQDATFSGGYINFRFRNSTGHHLLIRTVATDTAITVKLFGTLPKGTSYVIESKVVKTLEPPVQYVRSGSAGWQTLQAGKPGYIVDTYRYTRQNGVVTGKERISRDTYRPSPSVVTVPPGAQIPRERSTPSPEPMLEDGVFGPILEDGVYGPVFP